MDQVPIHAFPVDISESGETFAFDVSARALAFSAAVKALQLSDCDMSCSSARYKNVAPGVWTANRRPERGDSIPSRDGAVSGAALVYLLLLRDASDYRWRDTHLALSLGGALSSHNPPSFRRRSAPWRQVYPRRSGWRRPELSPRPIVAERIRRKRAPRRREQWPRWE